MTAPALIALAHGSRDPRSAATIKALVAEVRAHAPRPAHRAGVPRAVQAVASARSSTGSSRPATTRSSSCPLLLSEAYHAKVDVPDAVAEATDRHPGLRIRATDDPRPRAGLPRGARPPPARRAERRPGPRARRAGARRRRLLRPAGQPGRRPARPASGAPATSCPVTAAFASAAPPATGEAVRAFRAEGRRHVAVGSMFLAPGFLPDRAAELALEAGAVAVSEPLGRRPGAGPHHPGPLRRRRRRARPRLTPVPRDVAAQPADRLAAAARSSAAGSSVRPPCTGPGLYDGAARRRRNPNRGPGRRGLPGAVRRGRESDPEVDVRLAPADGVDGVQRVRRPRPRRRPGRARAAGPRRRAQAEPRKSVGLAVQHHADVDELLALDPRHAAQHDVLVALAVHRGRLRVGQPGARAAEPGAAGRSDVAPRAARRASPRPAPARATRRAPRPSTSPARRR